MRDCLPVVLQGHCRRGHDRSVSLEKRTGERNCPSFHPRRGRPKTCTRDHAGETMTTQTFRKTLSANDVCTTGGHMGGILIPKGEKELMAFLPSASMPSPCARECRRSLSRRVHQMPSVTCLPISSNRFTLSLNLIFFTIPISQPSGPLMILTSIPVIKP